MDTAALPRPEDIRLAVIGLGYVGLPLAVGFGRKLPTLGFDVNAARIEELRQHRDHTLEVSPDELKTATQLGYSSDPADLEDRNVFIVSVPTPVGRGKRPDLTPLKGASHTVGKAIGRGGLVVFESTVYPGATEEVCVPIIEEESGLKFNQDFYAGYSPERINPGDKQHRLDTIKKVTSGSTPEVADFVDALYRRVVSAGTHKASSIKVAEAAKVIENTQRDLNIALINELALIFHRLGIDTLEVLEAAGTKWNFLPFRPGLVGGHCIGVDPYYLTHKAEEIGYHPEVILSGRRINDGMGRHVAERVIRLMLGKRIQVAGARVLVLGLTFKENCPDLRNTRVTDILDEFKACHADVDVYDPWVDPAEARREYGIDVVSEPSPTSYDAIVLAVAHHQFTDMGAAALRALGKPGCV
ncbi:MAG: nucleotide sugar dehydrogenase, partial [Rhodanobacteraceae bacterium]